jgi:NAD(P)H-hydrate repair Nnr-like enzyme with NAD(P)H-hydrate dehydratase domain
LHISGRCRPLLYAGSITKKWLLQCCAQHASDPETGLATVCVTSGCEAILNTALPEKQSPLRQITRLKAESLKNRLSPPGPGLENTAKKTNSLKLLSSWRGYTLVIDATALSILISFTSFAFFYENYIRRCHTPYRWWKLLGKTNNDMERLQMATRAAILAVYCFKGAYTLIACLMVNIILIQLVMQAWLLRKWW